jgi:hypothetical protein
MVSKPSRTEYPRQGHHDAATWRFGAAFRRRGGVRSTETAKMSLAFSGTVPVYQLPDDAKGDQQVDDDAEDTDFQHKLFHQCVLKQAMS